MHVFGWPISTKIASLEWKVRSKVDAWHSRKFNRGLKFNPGGNKVFNLGASKEASKVTYIRSSSSYAEAIRVSHNNVNAKDTNVSLRYAPDVKETKRVELVKWEEEIFDSSWISLCAVGVFKKFFDVSSMIKRCSERNIQLSSFYLGDKNILWRFNSVEVRNTFIRRRDLWEDFFSFVGGRSCAVTPQYRLSWVEFSGIPLNVWCEEFFMKLGWAIGEPLLVEKETLSRDVLFKGRILSLIPNGRSCPSIIKVEIGRNSFSVSVRENPMTRLILCRLNSLVKHYL
ncbi:hypothetical protein Q3G72_002440 [Acer saccharum]|nr:hypothetical protein Q3G72_002440 [Acer saccharum]